MPANEPAKPKLLVVELWGLGDLVIATPFLKAATSKFDVTLLAKPYAEDLSKRFWPDVRVVPFTAPWTAFRHKYRLLFWPWRKILQTRELRTDRFEVGLSARWDPRDHFLLRALGARRRLGFPRLGSQFVLTDLLPRPEASAHRYEYWRVLGQALHLDLPERANLEVRARPHGDAVLVHTGAGQPVRVWPLDRYRSLVARLRRQNVRVRVACDPDQQTWWREAGETDVATPRTVTELFSLIDRASAFIGNDSGPGHLAAFCGVPTFTLFGPQLPDWFAPLHPEAEWIPGAPCRFKPCFDDCRFTTPHCLRDLREEAVGVRVRDFVVRHAHREGSLEATRPSPRAASRSLEPDSALSEPLRVLHVNNSADIYGASRMLLRFVKTVDRRRIRPIVVLPEDGMLKEMLEAEDVEVVMHPRLSTITRPVFGSWRLGLFILNYPVSVFFLWKLIKRQRIDVVHTNTGVMISPAMAAWLAGVPHIWHIRDWFQEFRSFWPAFAWYVRSLSRKIVAVSNAVANQFVPPALVVHDGFAMSEFELPKQTLGEQFRERYCLNGDFVVGCVGRIKYVRKGQEILVQATALLKRRGRRIKALIVGAPFPGNEEHLTQLEQLVRDLGIGDQVVFTGEIADARPAYAAMNVFALTSAQPEPFGGVVMEAMAMEVPVVATNIGGSLDQVVDGVTGLLVEPGDPRVLADAIGRLMDDPAACQRMGQAGMRRIRERFTLAEMTTALERLFEDVAIARKKAGPNPS